MSIHLTYREIGAILGTQIDSDALIEHVSFDTRQIYNGAETVFFAFKGQFRDGHDYISNAYDSGVRLFVVNTVPADQKYTGAYFILVNDSVKALQELAKHHRSKFRGAVIGITGSAGKTTVKEYLGTLLQGDFSIVRSPKSYNSQIGVAISLLGINPTTEIAIIEAGISEPGEMESLEQMIRPTIGILTSIGSAHIHNFRDKNELIGEKLKLFQRCEKVFYNAKIDLPTSDKFIAVSSDLIDLYTDPKSYTGVLGENLALALACANYFHISESKLKRAIQEIRPAALRLETFDGINGSLIINDSYSMDKEALAASLQYQLAISGKRKRILLAGVKNSEQRQLVEEVVQDFEPVQVHFIEEKDLPKIDLSNSVVLVKGDRSLKMEQFASALRQFKHETFVEIDLNAIRDNLQFVKSKLPAETKILSMVKASSYGSGAERLGLFLERIGVNYFGVAYPDEGIELRNAGVTLPIMVMNTERSSFRLCIENKLEPAIFSIEQLDEFIRELIYMDLTAYPIHLKLETGMNRLGFRKDNLSALIDTLQSQPEVKVKTVYSHLATADEPDSPYVRQQVELFRQLSQKIADTLHYTFDRHILNSDGALNYPEYHFEMIRVGIAMYGISSNPIMQTNLKPAIQWYSILSQIREIGPEDTVGYGRNGKLENGGKIAVVPVGYADGFRRILGNGNGGVYINGKFCPTVGNVCMDMIMVDVSNADATVGCLVEIIGKHQSIDQLAGRMETIPYEVLTSISKRVHRVYLES